MLTQKIIGTDYKKVKYHGQVKFLIFQCNRCGKNFSKMESYCKKQLRIHKHACCFCSPNCRNQYFNNRSLKNPLSQKKQPQSRSNKKIPSLFGWVNKLLKAD